MQVPVIVEELVGTSRLGEPLSVGIPLAPGCHADPSSLRLLDEQGATLPLQVETLTRWSDGSLRWVLLDTLVDASPSATRELTLSDVDDALPDTNLTVDTDGTEIRVSTGAVVATFPRSGEVLLASLRTAEGQPVLDEGEGLRLVFEDETLGRHTMRVTSVDLLCGGPVRATVEMRGRLGPVLEATVRISLWSGQDTLRCEIGVRNPRAAQHAGGTWDLGDPGSVCFRSLTLVAALQTDDARPEILWCENAKGPLERADVAHLELYQASSGGEHWDSPNHTAADLSLPLEFQGYRVRGDLPGRRGRRASPTFWMTADDRSLGATVHEFWQCFPKSLSVAGRRLDIALWPARLNGPHELQGGEQKTHTAWFAAGTPRNLGWTQTPVVARSTPQHYVASGAFPNLVEWLRDDNANLLALAAVVLDDEQGLAARRETIDEYGWRNFGDAWADHENVGNDGPRPRVSHYNNQYDGVYAMLAQFVRSGDPRWFRLADEMARHAADVDVYHTEQDRTAFSGGLFWHTDHYTEAATSTHRTYTRRCPAAVGGTYGGGPSAEHDYAAGLATHYFMTGWRPSRDAALSLADWVCRMDGPEDQGLFSLLPGPAGLASRTDDHTYHGPGRGAGNSVDTLLEVFELTEDERYLRKAEELIRRVVHPDDDRDEFQLLTNPETRWSYVVFLLALDRYLRLKAELGELDDRYGYAQAALVAYGRWMMDEETLSSAKKELLEIWTESWPAQDLRKGIVLLETAKHLDNDAEAALFRLRGRELFEAAQRELFDWETRTLTRPLFLVMRYGYQASALLQASTHAEAPRVTVGDLGKPSGFVSWKGLPRVAIARIKRLLNR